MPDSFTIRVGDRFECLMDGSDGGLATYEVASVASNGTVHAFNVRTGKERTFLGYGRMLPSEGGTERRETCKVCGTSEAVHGRPPIKSPLVEAIGFHEFKARGPADAGDD